MGTTDDLKAIRQYCRSQRINNNGCTKACFLHENCDCLLNYPYDWDLRRVNPAVKKIITPDI